ncbi:MAG: aldehyde ferredoxin oxidoreductase [Deltaproteobacteria bacterium]|nr:aldehyde ferredoxin oxidoreductase [Deltaproteobacteria bacterium]
MNEQKVREEEGPAGLSILGGRALIDKILTQEVDPTIHPLGKGNKLIFAPGLFAGTPIPNSGRLSVGAKSPLTYGVKESNGGGTVAFKLARLGIKALIIEDQHKDGPFVLVVKKDSIKVEHAPDLAMLGNYELCTKLREKHGQAAISSIGPCGEMGMSASTVAITDTNGFPSRHCGRGGLGAVMGSKGLKAVIVDDSGAAGRKPVHSKTFRKDIKEVVEFIKNNPRTGFFRSEGTPGMIALANDRGSLPTRNHHFGAFEGFDGISSRKMAELQEERGGSMTHGCMPGCIVKCSNVYFDNKKVYLTSGLEYESLAMLGANLEISDLDIVAAMERKCDDYGLDTIDVGSALGVLGEHGLFEFGNGKQATDILDQIGDGSALGRILGQGVAFTCRAFGIDRIPAVKGQAIPAHCSRAMKGVGVTYATSPQGADHTAGFVGEENLSPVGHAERSRNAQMNMMLMDSMGFCYFSLLMGNFQICARLIESLCGVDCSEESVFDMVKAALKEEKAFNGRAGITEAADRLPEFLGTEPLAPNNSVFDVPDEDLKAVFGKL